MNELKKLFLLRAFGYEYAPLSLPYKQEFKTLDELKNALSSCKLCNAYGCEKEFLNSTLFKLNNDKIMFLKQKMQAGDKARLDLLMKKAGVLNYELDYLIKCERGVNERSLELCKPYTQELLALKKPKLVICLGKDAADFFHAKNALVGELFVYKDMKILIASSLDMLGNEKNWLSFCKDLKKGEV